MDDPLDIGQTWPPASPSAPVSIDQVMGEANKAAQTLQQKPKSPNIVGFDGQARAHDWPEWEKVQPLFKQVIPELPDDGAKELYEHYRVLHTYRTAAREATDAQLDPQGAAEYLPFAGSIKSVLKARQYDAAKKAFEAGDPGELSYHPQTGEPLPLDKVRHYDNAATIARQEELARRQAEMTTGQAVGHALARVPAVVGEAMVGGAVTKGIGFAGRGLFAGGVNYAKEAAKGLAGYGLRTAAQAAAMPSLWAEQWTKNNQEAGRDPLDLRGAAPAYAVGTLQTAVLGSLGKVANAMLPGEGIAKALARIPIGAGTGMVEQQAADALAGAVGLQSDYGILGDLLEGKKGEALKKATVQAVTFAAFAALHHGPEAGKKVLDAYSKNLGESAKEGLKPEEAGWYAKFSQEEINQLIENVKKMRQQAAPPEGPDPEHVALAEQLMKEAQNAPEDVTTPKTTQGPEAPSVEDPQGGEGAPVGGEAQGGETPPTGNENPPKLPETTPAQGEVPGEPTQPVRGAEGDADRPAPEPATSEGAGLPGQPGPATAEGLPPSEPRVLGTVKRETVLDRLRQPDREMPASLQEAFAQAGLSKQEQHIIQERLHGRTHPDIALDDPMLKSNGGSYTKQRVQQMERNALKKLGLPADFTVRNGIHEINKADRVADFAEQNGAVDFGELRNTDAGLAKKLQEKRLTKLEQESRELSALAEELEKAYDAGTYTESQKADFERRGNEIHQRLAGRRGASESEPQESPVSDAQEGATPEVGDIHPAAEGFLRELHAQGQPQLFKDLVEHLKGHTDPNKVNALARQIKKEVQAGTPLKEITTSREQGAPRQIEGGERKWQIERELNKRISDYEEHGPGVIPQEVEPGVAFHHEPGLFDPLKKFLLDQEGARPIGGGKTPEPEGVPAHNEPYLKFGLQRTFPGLTKLSPKASQPAAEAAAAPAIAEQTLRYMKNRLEVGGKRLAEHGEDDLPTHRLGAALLQTRMDMERAASQQETAQKLQDLQQKTNALRRQNPQITPGQLATQLQKEMAAYQAARKHAADVRTLIGGQSSAAEYHFTDKADYDAAKKELDALIAQGEWGPVAEEWYKKAMNNLPPDRNQIKDFPMKAIALDPDTGLPIGAARTGTNTTLANERIRRMSQSRQASLEHDLYDTSLIRMMDETMRERVPEAARANTIKVGLQEGTIRHGDQSPQGWREMMFKMGKGIPELPQGERWFTHPDAYHDYERALGIEQTLGQKAHEALHQALGTVPGARKAADVAGLLVQASLATPGELMTHLGVNIPRMLWGGEGFNPHGLPLEKLPQFITGMWKAWKNNPDFLKKLVDVTQLGSGYEPREVRGVFANHSLDPTYAWQKFAHTAIQLGQESGRVLAGDVFDSLVASGKKPGGEAAKRDFINEYLGNYNGKAANAGIEFLKAIHLQEFSTAASTTYEQTIKAGLGFVGNAPNATWKQAITNRALQTAKLLPLLALPAIYNKLRFDDWFPDDIPPFAFKTDEGYRDLLSVVGVRQGWRHIGAEAAFEGKPDKAVKDVAMGLLHPVAGPVPDFLVTAVTGHNMRGEQLAERVSTAKTPKGIIGAMRRGSPPPDASQTWENLKAALVHANPILKAFFPQTKRERAQSGSQTLESLLPGSFQERTTPVKPRRLGTIPR